MAMTAYPLRRKLPAGLGEPSAVFDEAGGVVDARRRASAPVDKR